MSTNQNQSEEYLEIDLLQLARELWKHALLIMLVTVLCAAITFAVTKYFITPTYRSSILIYVNNSSFSLGDTSVSISSGDISASRSLLSTYIVILKARSTLEEVATESGLEYTYDDLDKMVTAGAENNTEVLKVTVTSTSPADCKTIANTIAKVLPERIAGIIDGSSAKVVDFAVIPTKRYSPSYTKNTAIGGLLGAVLTCGIILLVMLTDTIVHDEDTLKNSYADIPVLAAIPDLREQSSGSGYYGTRSQSKSRTEKQTKSKTKSEKQTKSLFGKGERK